MRGRAALAALACAAALPAAANAGHPGEARTAAVAPAAPGCPERVDPSAFTAPDQLLAWNQKMSDFGRRPTGSRNHKRFVRWLVRQARAIPGVQMDSRLYEIDRFVGGRTRLAAGAPGKRLRRVAIAGRVPYSQRTPRRGIRGELAYVPAGTPIEDADVKGKVVVRDVVPGTIPRAAFLALAWWYYDPETRFLPETLDSYERDYLGYMALVEDLRAAANAGAAGAVFVHGFPRAQVRGHYAPYEGEKWKLPAVYVGADEGERLKQLAAQGGRARIKLKARHVPTRVRNWIATIPGASGERLVVESHTDGMNAVWDNGPIGMLGLARYFAALPGECRPRTINFVFTTAHLYLQIDPGKRDGGAGKYAEELDQAYDRGEVAAVLAMEHMGAREYKAVARPDGGPGRVLVPSGLSEASGLFVGESPLLVQESQEAFTGRDVKRTIALRGADLPGVHFPVHHSFGGEGTAYHLHLIPTVALVAGPWSLYNPAFGMEAIDADLLYKQTLAFGDILHGIAPASREALAGAYLIQRPARELLCGAFPGAFGLVQC